MPLSDQVARRQTLLLTRSPRMAEAAARLTTGDAFSVVLPSLTDEIAKELAEVTPDDVVLEGAVDDPIWLRGALELARAIVTPGSSVRLVFDADASSIGLEPAMQEALSGWVASGISVDRELVSVRLQASSEDVDPGILHDTLKGAQSITSLLHVLVDPAAHDLPDFGYRSSQTMAYLRETPRVHAEIESLRAQVLELTAANNELKRRTRLTNGRGKRIGKVGVASGPGVSGMSDATGSHESGRTRKMTLAVFGIALAGLSTWVALSIGVDVALVVSGAVLAAVVALAWDNRRRAMRLHGYVRSVADRLSTSIDRVRSDLAVVGEEVIDSLRGSSNLTASIAGRTAAVADSVQRTQAVAETILELSEARDQRLDLIASQVGDFEATVRSELLMSYRHVERDLRLRSLALLFGSTATVRGPTVSPNVIVLLLNELLDLKPKLIVECGSGVSTVWLAMACKSAGIGARIVALEHDPDSAAETGRLLAACGVDDIAQVRLAPLGRLELEGYEGNWYPLSALDDLDGIGLLFVDDPRDDADGLALFPALPVFGPRLADTATVVLNDLLRSEEMQVLGMWIKEFPQMTVTHYPFDEGAAALRVGIR